MYKNIISISVGLSLLLTSCVSSPATRGSGASSSHATRAVEVVDGNTQTYPRIALVIGNNKYERGTLLTNAVPDARAMRDFLGAKGFKVVYAEDANLKKMKSKIEEFMASLGRKSISVIYYSGHASQDISRAFKVPTNYLIPIDNGSLFTIGNHDDYAIRLNSILNDADEINHGLNIAMLDACRTPVVKRGNIPVKNISPEGIYLVYSTASGVEASDSSLFRKSFIRNANRPLKLIEIFEEVKLEVYNQEGQEPFVSNGKRGTFFFTEPSKPVPTPVVKPQIVYRDRPTVVAPTPIPRPVVPTTQKGKWNSKIYRGERSYSKNSTNTVKDNYTGLIWQKEDDGVKRSWSDAKSYCSSLSLDGSSSWRLPTQEELYYLGDMTKSKPAIDSSYFDIENNYYWSDTTYKNDSSYAWSVYFKFGGDYWYSKSSKYLALCVR